MVEEEEKKNDGKEKNRTRGREDDKNEGQTQKILKENDQHGLFDFVTRLVNIFPVCYIYKTNHL